MPRLPTYLVQELDIGTVAVTVAVSPAQIAANKCSNPAHRGYSELQGI